MLLFFQHTVALPSSGNDTVITSYLGSGAKIHLVGYDKKVHSTYWIKDPEIKPFNNLSSSPYHTSDKIFYEHPQYYLPSDYISVAADVAIDEEEQIYVTGTRNTKLLVMKFDVHGSLEWMNIKEQGHGTAIYATERVIYVIGYQLQSCGDGYVYCEDVDCSTTNIPRIMIIWWFSRHDGTMIKRDILSNIVVPCHEQVYQTIQFQRNINNPEITMVYQIAYNTETNNREIQTWEIYHNKNETIDDYYGDVMSIRMIKSFPISYDYSIRSLAIDQHQSMILLSGHDSHSQSSNYTVWQYDMNGNVIYTTELDYLDRYREHSLVLAGSNNTVYIVSDWDDNNLIITTISTLNGNITDISSIQSDYSYLTGGLLTMILDNGDLVIAKRYDTYVNRFIEYMYYSVTCQQHLVTLTPTCYLVGYNYEKRKPQPYQGWNIFKLQPYYNRYLTVFIQKYSLSPSYSMPSHVLTISLSIICILIFITILCFLLYYHYNPFTLYIDRYITILLSSHWYAFYCRIYLIIINILEVADIISDLWWVNTLGYYSVYYSDGDIEYRFFNNLYLISRIILTISILLLILKTFTNLRLLWFESKTHEYVKVSLFGIGAIWTLAFNDFDICRLYYAYNEATLVNEQTVFSGLLGLGDAKNNLFRKEHSYISWLLSSFAMETPSVVSVHSFDLDDESLPSSIIAIEGVTPYNPDIDIEPTLNHISATGNFLDLLQTPCIITYNFHLFVNSFGCLFGLIIWIVSFTLSVISSIVTFSIIGSLNMLHSANYELLIRITEDFPQLIIQIIYLSSSYRQDDLTLVSVFSLLISLILFAKFVFEIVLAVSRSFSVDSLARPKFWDDHIPNGGIALLILTWIYPIGMLVMVCIVDLGGGSLLTTIALNLQMFPLPTSVADVLSFVAAPFTYSGLLFYGNAHQYYSQEFIDSIYAWIAALAFFIYPIVFFKSCTLLYDIFSRVLKVLRSIIRR